MVSQIYTRRKFLQSALRDVVDYVFPEPQLPQLNSEYLTHGVTPSWLNTRWYQPETMAPGDPGSTTFAHTARSFVTREIINPGEGQLMNPPDARTLMTFRFMVDYSSPAFSLFFGRNMGQDSTGVAIKGLSVGGQVSHTSLANVTRTYTVTHATLNPVIRQGMAEAIPIGTVWKYAFPVTTFSDPTTPLANANGALVHHLLYTTGVLEGQGALFTCFEPIPTVSVISLEARADQPLLENEIIEVRHKLATYANKGEDLTNVSRLYIALTLALSQVRGSNKPINSIILGQLLPENYYVVGLQQTEGEI